MQKAELASEGPSVFENSESWALVVTIIVFVFIGVIMSAFYVIEKKKNESHETLARHNYVAMQNFVSANKPASSGFSVQESEFKDYPDLIKNEDKKKRGRKVATLETNVLLAH